MSRPTVKWLPAFSLVATCIFFLHALPARAFKPDIHSSITVETLLALAERVPSSAEPIKFSLAATVEVNEGNVSQDSVFGDSFTTSEIHVDNEALLRASNDLYIARGRIVAYLLGNPVTDEIAARRLLGKSLHTIQDFYSHTTWINQGRNGLARLGEATTDPAIGEVGPAIPTCEGTGGLLPLISAPLSSGIFSLNPLADAAAAERGKCIHGYGPLIGIHKDDESRGMYYFTARLRATDATQDYVRKILSDLRALDRPDLICRLMGQPVTLCLPPVSLVSSYRGSQALPDGFLYTESAAVFSDNDVRGIRCFTNGLISGSYRWTGRIERTSSTEGTLIGGGTLTLGNYTQPFALSGGTIRRWPEGVLVEWAANGAAIQLRDAGPVPIAPRECSPQSYAVFAGTTNWSKTRIGPVSVWDYPGALTSHSVTCTMNSEFSQTLRLFLPSSPNSLEPFGGAKGIARTIRQSTIAGPMCTNPREQLTFDRYHAASPRPWTSRFLLPTVSIHTNGLLEPYSPSIAIGSYIGSRYTGNRNGDVISGALLNDVPLVLTRVRSQPGPILDTGEPRGTSFSNVAYTAAQFNVSSPTQLTNALAFIRVLGAGTATVALYSDRNGLPGVELFSQFLQLPASPTPQWLGPRDINWTIPAGTFWISFETRVGQTAVAQFLLGSVPEDYPPRPAVMEAGLLPGVSGFDSWFIRGGRRGWRLNASNVSPVVATTIVPVNSRATFLRTNAETTALDTIPIDLASLHLGPGDTIQLDVLGDFTYSDGNLPDEFNPLIGVFSSSSDLLPASNLDRVPGAIDTGNEHISEPTLFGGISTDIAQDFPVGFGAIQIPIGARYLFVAAPDIFYSDNADPDGDFALRITRVQAN